MSYVHGALPKSEARLGRSTLLLPKRPPSALRHKVDLIFELFN